MHFRGRRCHLSRWDPEHVEDPQSDDPSGNVQPKKIGVHVFKRFMSNTALIQINSIDRTVLLDWLSIVTQKNERVISLNTVSQEDVCSQHKIEDELYGNIPLTSNSLHEKDKYFVEKIIGRDLIEGKTV